MSKETFECRALGAIAWHFRPVCLDFGRGAYTPAFNFVLVVKMKRGWFKQWRKEEDSSIWQKPPIYGRVWQWIKMNADYSTGEIKDKSLSFIADSVSWYEKGHKITPNKMQIKRILDWMETTKMIVVDCDATVTAITVLNWDIYNNSENCDCDATVTALIPYKEFKEVKEVDLKGKEVHPSDVSVPVAPTPQKVRKQKLPTDPATDPTYLLKNISSDKNIIVEWARDGKIIKNLLKREKDLGVPEPQKAVYERWQAFMNGAANGHWSMKGSKAKSIPKFKLVYEELLIITNNSTSQHKIRDMNQRPISEPWRRWREIKTWYPNAQTDPDLDYEFRLTDEQVQAEANPFKQPMPKGSQNGR